MKKLQILLLAFVTTISFSSCSDDEGFTFIAQEDPDGISFVNSTSANYVLRANNSQGLGERFVWNAPDFDVPTTIRYELQGSADPTFENFDVVGPDIAETNYAVTVGQMISLAEDAGLDNDPSTEAPNTGTIYFRVMAYAGTNTNNNVVQTSEPIAINVELFEGEGEEEPALPNFFLVGDATAAGWSENNNNTPLFRDGENENIFYYTGRFAGGAAVEGFKLLESLGSWQPQWGVTDDVLTNSDILGGDPGAFKVAADAYYTFTMDVEAMTYSFEPYDASGAATYASIGVIGDATADAWDADQDMTKSSFDPHIWYVKGIELGEGEMKFRADDAWDVNWGGNTAMSGQATVDGPNFPVTAGTYDIWFNDITGRYLLIKR